MVTARHKHPGIANVAFLLMLGEPFLLLILSILAYFLRQGVEMASTGYWSLTLLGVMVFILATHGTGLYEARQIRRPLHALPRLLGVLGIAFTSLVSLLFMLKISGEYSRIWVGIWFSLAFVILGLARLWVALVVHRKFRSGQWRRHIAIWGVTPKTQEIMRLLARQKSREISLFGVYEETINDVNKDFLGKGVTFRGGFSRLIQDGTRNQFDTLIIAANLNTLPEAHAQLAELRKLSVNVYYCLPTPLFGLTLGNTEGLYRIPMVLIMRRPLEGPELLLKRGLDILVASLCMIPFSLIFLAIAPLVKLSSPGPIFFRQPRNGLNGKTFGMLKFRSMRTGEAPKDKDGKEKQAQKDDPRITPIGRILRKTSLDETPQILNILLGDMSLVGPRPHALSHDDYYSKLIDSYTTRHKIRPGLTGWAQLNGWRGETDTLEKMAKRVEFDIWYIENWSLWLDIKIILLTPLTMLFQKQAY